MEASFGGSKKLKGRKVNVERKEVKGKSRRYQELIYLFYISGRGGSYLLWGKEKTLQKRESR